MSRSVGNASGRSVTLHVVSSLDGFIAEKDNSISWLNGTGSVYEPGISISEEEAAIFVKADEQAHSVSFASGTYSGRTASNGARRR